MEKWRRQFYDCLQFCRTHEKYMKIAVIALVVITALVFFGIKGEDEGIQVVQDGTQSAGFTETEENGTSVPEETEANEVELVVDISGGVKKPGVYHLAEGARLYELIDCAGGLTDEADTTSINQAEILFDGQKIIVPEVNPNETDALTNNALPAGISADGKVNLNLADSTTLQEIPGVGPATAEKIITYRETVGKFKSIEEIKEVDGIGEKTFEKIKDMLTI